MEQNLPKKLLAIIAIEQVSGNQPAVIADEETASAMAEN